VKDICCDEKDKERQKGIYTLERMGWSTGTAYGQLERVLKTSKSTSEGGHIANGYDFRQAEEGIEH
jgi:hypothetical protein